MSAEASTPTTEPCGRRAAISAVVFPFPQPISRTRSVPLRSSRARTSLAIAACRAEILAYSEAFHSVILAFLSCGKTNATVELSADGGGVGGEYEPFRIAGNVF